MKIFEILLEYNRDITKQKIGDKLTIAGHQDRNADIDTILQTLEEIDPTPNKQYVLWLSNQYMKNLFRLEDKLRVKDVLEKFIKVKSRLPEKDIGRYTFHTLQDKMDELFNVQLSTKPAEPEQQTFQIPRGVKALYNGPLGLLAIPLSYKASCTLGSGTKWCTAATDDPIDARKIFQMYTEDGPLYIWRDKNGEKYQFHFSWKNTDFQFMDSKDREIPEKLLNYFREEHPVLKKMFEKEERGKKPYDLLALAEHLGKRIPKAEKYFDTAIKNQISSDNYYLLQSINSYILSAVDTPVPEIEHMLFKLGNIDTLFIYWEKVYNLTPWPKLETYILNNKNTGRNAYSYALRSKKRFLEAEKYILRIKKYITNYATYVIKNRWPEGEEKLKTNPQLLYYYAVMFKTPFKEAEEYAKQHPEHAMIYATEALKKRWPEAEKIIASDRYSLIAYCKFFHIGILKVLSKYPKYIFKYWHDLSATQKEQAKTIINKYPNVFELFNENPKYILIYWPYLNTTQKKKAKTIINKDLSLRREFKRLGYS